MSRLALLLPLFVLTLLAGCRSAAKMVAPSNVRDWQPDQAQVSHAEFDGEQVTIHNVRGCRYLNDDVYIPNYYDKRVNLNDLKTVDFIVCPFVDTPDIAHTMLSFGFEDAAGNRDQLVLSVEIRKERGEEYAAWKGIARQYEIMYVLADEQDVIGVRVHHRGEDVYLYRSTATPEQASDLFADVLERTNKLARAPEFYDTLANNCTNNIVRHINRLNPGRVAFDYRILLPGHSDQLAYDLGLIEKHGTFEETKERAHIHGAVERFAGRADFSERIRMR